MKHKIVTIILIPALFWIYSVAKLFGYLDDSDMTFWETVGELWKKGF